MTACIAPTYYASLSCSAGQETACPPRSLEGGRSRAGSRCLGVLVVQLAFTTKSQRHQESLGPQVVAGGCTLPDRYSIIVGTGQLLRLAKEPDARLPPMPENESGRHGFLSARRRSPHRPSHGNRSAACRWTLPPISPCPPIGRMRHGHGSCVGPNGVRPKGERRSPLLGAQSPEPQAAG
jgi:hypothetical protein